MKKLTGAVLLLLGLAGAGLFAGSATAYEEPEGSQPQTMNDFLTSVTKDVDTYWTKTFEASGLTEPRVSYAWIPAGQAASSACGPLGDSAAAYCPADDTIYISEKFASDIYNGALDHALPGSSQGFGRTYGDFAVAYIVAHEYGHQIQDELGLFQQYGSTRRCRSSSRPIATPAPGPTAPTRRTVSTTATWRKRSTPRSPSATSTPPTPATTARPSSAVRRGSPASSRATRRPAA